MLDRQRLARRLAEMEIVYRTGRTPEEIAVLADIWAEDLADEKPEDVERAMQRYRLQSRFFPTPADIVAILDDGGRERTHRALPDARPRHQTPGIGHVYYRLFRKEITAAQAKAEILRLRNLLCATKTIQLGLV
ncbi:MAG: hypothetical protein IJU37_09525 [Desulfovibrio sp.]|nr:hypothetical protein [Desulfovibrio sp.]